MFRSKKLLILFGAVVTPLGLLAVLASMSEGTPPAYLAGSVIFFGGGALILLLGLKKPLPPWYLQDEGSGREREGRKLDAAEARRRRLELRDLWNEFDPIGVYADAEWKAPPDEYEAYLDFCLRLLEHDAPENEIAYHVYAALEHIGLGDLPDAGDRARAFAGRMKAWYRDRWRGTWAEEPTPDPSGPCRGTSGGAGS